MKDRIVILDGQLPVTTGDSKDRVSLYLADGYLSGIQPKNFSCWFYICDAKGRRIRLVAKK